MTVPWVSRSTDTLTAGIDGRYRTWIRHTARLRTSDITGAAVYTLGENGGVTAQSSTAAAWSFLYLDPDDWSITGRSTKLRVVAACAVNDNAPAITMTVGLHPVGTPSGGVNVFNANLAAAVTGTTIAFATPAANSKSVQTYTTDIALPSEGWYGVGVEASGAMAANSVVEIPLRVEIRNV